MPGGMTPGAGGKGIGSSVSPVKSLNKELAVTVPMMEKLTKLSKEFYGAMKDTGGSSGVGMSRMGGGSALAMGSVATVMGAGHAMYNALPDTVAAVQQRMAVSQVASFSGRGVTPASVLTRANAANNGGFTSAQGMSEAAATFMGMGYSFNSNTVQGNLRRIGGMSVISGLSNEQVAAGISSTNAMNYLRVGIMARNPDGSLKPINQIAGQLYNRMYMGRNPNAEQAAAVFRTNSNAYKTIASVAGGDPNMIRMLQSSIVMQAKNGGKALDTADVNKMMNAMGWDKNSPERKQFQLASAQARQLQTTGDAQVAGYSAALDAAAKLTDAFNGLYKAMGPVSASFASMQGFLSTFRNTGNVANAAANFGGAVAGGAMNIAQTAMIMRGINMYRNGGGGAGPVMNALREANAARQAGGAAAGAASIWSSAGRGLKALSKNPAARFGSKALGVVGAGLAAWDAWNTGAQDKDFSWGHMFGSIASGALSGGLMAGGWGALGGAFAGAGIYAAGHFFGGGGPDYGSGGGQPDNATTVTPVPGAHVTTPYHALPKNNTYWQWKGYHTGVDYAAKSGTRVVAAKSGKVMSENPGKAYGISVMIDHGDGTQALYGHLSKKVVRSGQKVNAGQLIGFVGETGDAHGPHLHFEIRKGHNNPVNPSNWLSRAAGAVKSFIGKVGSAIGSAWNSLTGKRMGSGSGAGNAMAGGAGQTFGMPTNMTGFSSGGTGVLDLLGGDTLASGGYHSGGMSGGGGGGGGGGSYGDGGTSVGNSNLLKILKGAGFSGESLRVAYGIAMAESGGRPRAHNGKGKDDSYGLFQINMIGQMGKDRLNNKYFQKYGVHKKEDLYNPEVNARIAYYMSKGKDWGSWSTYTSGAYKDHMPSTQAVASALGTGGGHPDGDGPSKGVVIHAQFNITAKNSSASEAAILAKQVAKLLEKEVRDSRIGSF